METVTYAELSKRWKLSRVTLERQVRKGQIPKPLKIGGSVRFPLAAILEFERRQAGDLEPAEAEADALDQALAAACDRLAAMDGPAGTSSWSRREASRYRDLLSRLETLDESGLDKLAKLAHQHGTDDSHLEFHSIAVRLHAESQPIAAALPERQAALSKLTQTYNVGLGTVDERILRQQTEARNRVTESHNAARIVTYLGCIYPWLLGAAPSHVLEPRTGLLSPLLNRAAELGLRDELLGALRGETEDDAADEPDGTPAVPWWQNRKLPDAGAHPTPSQEAMNV